MNRRRIIPLIRLYDNLIVPIQTELSDELMARLTEDVTGAIEQSPISGLIIDLTGLDVMDSYVTRCVRDLALTTRVMGVDTIVCGMRWAVVITLVEMGLSIPGVRTALNLERALSMLAPRELEEGQPDDEQANEAQEIADADAPLVEEHIVRSCSSDGYAGAIRALDRGSAHPRIGPQLHHPEHNPGPDPRGLEA